MATATVLAQLAQKVVLARVLVVDVGLATEATGARHEPGAVVKVGALVQVEGQHERRTRLLVEVLLAHAESPRLQ